MKIRRLHASALLASLLTLSAQGELRIPGFTAYTLPEPNALGISEKNGVTRWNDPDTAVN